MALVASRAVRLTDLQGKQARALVRGHHHNKSFQEALQKLDEALAALRDRASALRDGAIVTSRKTSENVETIVNKVAVTGAVVNSRTRTTLHQVQSLQKDTRDMKFIAEHTDVQLSAVTEGIKTFTKTQDSINVKIDDVQVAQRTAHVKIDDLHGAQRLIHSQVETMSDVQQAKDQAAKAMEIAMETAECKCDGFRKCLGWRCGTDSRFREEKGRQRYPSVEKTAEQARKGQPRIDSGRPLGYPRRQRRRSH